MSPTVWPPSDEAPDEEVSELREEEANARIAADPETNPDDVVEDVRFPSEDGTATEEDFEPFDPDPEAGAHEPPPGAGRG